MIPVLPKWCLTNRLPAFYDLESATAIEQTAKLYGAMQGMIDDYNKFVDEFNKTFEDYVNGLNKDHECFQASITKLIHDYIGMLDEKLKMQDEEIENAVKYMKENLSSSITSIIAEMKEMGELDQAVLDAIDGIGTRVANLETEITNINTSLDTLDETDNSHNSRLTTLEMNVAEIQENETSTNERVTNLETMVTEIENRTSNIENQTTVETIDVSYLNSFTAHDDWVNKLVYEPITKRCTLFFGVEGTIATSGLTAILKIPDEYKLSKIPFSYALFNSGDLVGRCHLTNGILGVTPMSNSVDSITNAQGQITWFIE